MDVKEAVNRAKDYVRDVFADEGVSNLGLEEVEYDDLSDHWLVTIGFSRPWNTVRNALTAVTGEQAARRTYKVIRLKDGDGGVVSVRRRETKEDA